MSKETKKKGTKKPYQKPEIVYEDFSLTTNIAAGCEAKTNLPSNNTCGMLISGLYVFMEGMNGCSDWEVEENGNYNGICYHTPTDQNNLFNS